MNEEPETPEQSDEDFNNMEGLPPDEPQDEKPHEQPKQTEKKPMGELVAREDGAFIGHTLDEQYRLAKMYVKSGIVPKQYKHAEQIITAMQYAVGIGLPAILPSLRNISVINGQAEIWGELPLKLCRESGELESIDEYLIDKDKKKIDYIDSWDMIYAAVCTTKRRGQPAKTTTFTRWQAEQAIHGIEAIWKGYYNVMMKRKCRAINLKDSFGDILGGVRIAEYDSHNAPDLPSIKDVTDTGSEAQADLDSL